MVAKGVFGGMEPKLREMAEGIKAALAENAKTNAEVNLIKGRVAKIENSPTLRSEDLTRELKKLMDTIELKLEVLRKQGVPVSQYNADQKATVAKLSVLERMLSTLSIAANAESAPSQAPQAQRAQPTYDPEVKQREYLWSLADSFGRRQQIRRALAEKCKSLDVEAIDNEKLKPLVESPTEKGMQALVACSAFTSVAASPAPRAPVRVTDRTCPRGQFWEGPDIGCL